MRLHTNLILSGLMLLTGSISDLSAQSYKSCGHDHTQSQLFETPEAFEKAKSDVLKGAYSKYLRTSGQKNNATINIPVVFHIIHAGEVEGVGSNIPAGRVQAQLDVLNEDFSATNATYSDVTRPAWDSIKGNPLITFCLASKDPNGIATSGIVRHDIEITGADANNNNIEDVKANVFWDSEKYMNVYVLSIPGTDEFGGVVGYAYLPYFGTVGTSTDGIVVDYNWFGGDGYPQSGAKTLTHEVGHYLGLFHTFNGSSCSEDDGLTDTPNVDDATSSVNGSLTCGDPMNPYPTGPTSCGSEHMYINYMDYVNDESCPTSFTLDQVAIIRGVLEGTAPAFTTRAPLVANANTACSAPSCDLAASVTSTNATCSSTVDGTATVTASAGTGPYTYQWTGGQTTATVTGLAAGIYYVTTTDSATCTIVDSTIITEPSNLTISASATNETAVDANDGTVSVNVSGGTPGYTYQWNNGLGTDAGNTGLAPGAYNVTVTDANNCSTTAGAEVAAFDCSDFDITLTGGDLLCAGDDSVLSVSNVVSTGPFSYSWNTGETIDAITISSGGTYIVSIQDGNGCISSESKVIADAPSGLAISFTTYAESGTDTNDGRVETQVDGGTLPYTYTWSNGATNSILDNLSPGTYSLTVSDFNNCTETGTATVNEFTCSPYQIDFSVTDISCNGEADGVLDAYPAAAGIFTYLWSNGETTKVINSLDQGTYMVTVTDTNGCTAVASATVNQPTALNIDINKIDETADNANDGQITTIVTGGIPSYTYDWSDGSTSADRSGLAPGTYSVTATDSTGCSNSAIVTIGEYNCSAIIIAPVLTDVGCAGDASGSIVLNIQDIIAPYMVLWSTGSTEEQISNIIAGSYEVTLTDAGGCELTRSFVLVESSVLFANTNSTDETANDSSDGTASVFAQGGTAPYTYLWSNGASGSDVSNLSPGEHAVTVTDANGCTHVKFVGVAAYVCPSFDIININKTENLCSGEANGTLGASISGGTTPYEFNWSNGSISAVIDDLTAGMYSVTITDSKNCTVSGSESLVDPSALAVSHSVSHVSSVGANDGSVSLAIQGGTSPYTIIWNTNDTTENINALDEGTYVYTVSDHNECSHTGEVSVEQYVCPVLSIIFETTNITCNGAGDGVLHAIVDGGTAPYSYSWTTSATDDMIDALITGTYIVTVTDARGCDHSGSASITEPELLSSSSVVTNENRGNANNGSARVNITGGTMPYEVMWADGVKGELRTDMSPGDYAYAVLDANRCVTTGELVIEEFDCPVIELSTTVFDNECEDADVGGVDVEVSNGTAPYEYQINGVVQEGASIRGISAGTYELIVVDVNGCSATANFDVESPMPMVAIEISTEDTSGNLPGSATVTVLGGSEPYRYLWSDGRTNQSNNALFPGIHNVTITDSLDCVLVQEVIIHQLEDIESIEDLMLFESHPNPAADMVTIQVEFEVAKDIRIIITNISGQPVFDELLNTDVYNRQIDISGYPKGLYKINVFSADEVITKSLAIF